MKKQRKQVGELLSKLSNVIIGIGRSLINSSINRSQEFVRPTFRQFEFCMTYPGKLTPEQHDAIHYVMKGYLCDEMVHRDYIDIVDNLMKTKHHG
jgi:hypothetical protein